MNITVNGKPAEGPWRTAYEARDALGAGCDVVIVNGFQIDGDCGLKEGDALHLIQKGVMPGKEELESMMAARHTPRVQKCVKQGTVAVAGLGGLGSHIAVMLARTGVGCLRLLDFDVVEPSNLNRQSYGIGDLGMPKTVAMERQLRQINPYIQVSAHTVRVTGDNAAELLQGCDVVCEAFDKSEAKAMLVNTVLSELPGVRVVSASGMAGFDSSNRIQTQRRMKNLYVCGDFTSEARAGNGLMAPRVEICAGHQANMALRLLLGIEEV